MFLSGIHIQYDRSRDSKKKKKIFKIAWEGNNMICVYVTLILAGAGILGCGTSNMSKQENPKVLLIGSYT